MSGVAPDLERARRLLQSHARVGVQVHDAGGRAADLVVVSDDGVQLQVVVKKTGAARTEEAKGMLAIAILERLKSGMPDLLLLQVDRVGPQVARAVTQFVSEHDSQIGWGMFDAAGGVALYVPRLEIDLWEPPVDQPVRPRRGQSYTDLNRWLLKVLLREGATGSPPRNPSVLADLAQVSRAKAYRFTRALSEAGGLTRGRRGLALSDAQSVLRDWLGAQRVEQPRRYWAQGVFGDETPESVLQRAAAIGLRAAIGGFAACRRHGAAVVTHTRPVEIHLDVGVAPPPWADLDLLPCQEARDASFELLVSRFPESVFRPLEWDGPAGTVDLWQAALDVVADPVRGEEQAEHVLSKLLHGSDDE